MILACIRCLPPLSPGPLEPLNRFLTLTPSPHVSIPVFFSSVLQLKPVSLAIGDLKTLILALRAEEADVVGKACDAIESYADACESAADLSIPFACLCPFSFQIPCSLFALYRACACLSRSASLLPLLLCVAPMVTPTSLCFASRPPSAPSSYLSLSLSLSSYLSSPSPLIRLSRLVAGTPSGLLASSSLFLRISHSLVQLCLSFSQSICLFPVHAHCPLAVRHRGIHVCLASRINLLSHGSLPPVSFHRSPPRSGT